MIMKSYNGSNEWIRWCISPCISFSRNTFHIHSFRHFYWIIVIVVIITNKQTNTNPMNFPENQFQPNHHVFYANSSLSLVLIHFTSLILLDFFLFVVCSFTHLFNNTILSYSTIQWWIRNDLIDQFHTFKIIISLFRIILVMIDKQKSRCFKKEEKRNGRQYPLCSLKAFMWTGLRASCTHQTLLLTIVDLHHRLFSLNLIDLDRMTRILPPWQEGRPPQW